jgi:hypothetical protein
MKLQNSLMKTCGNKGGSLMRFVFDANYMYGAKRYVVFIWKESNPEKRGFGNSRWFTLALIKAYRDLGL